MENSNKQANKRHFCCTCPQDKGYRSLPRRWSVKVCARAPLAKRPMTSPEQSGLCLSGEWEFQCVDETLRGTFSSTQLGAVRRTKLLSSGTNCWIFLWWKQLKYRPMRLFSHQWGKLKYSVKVIRSRSVLEGCNCPFVISDFLLFELEFGGLKMCLKFFEDVEEVASNFMNFPEVPANLG